MADRYTITVALEGRDNLSDELRQVNTQLTQIEQNTRRTSTSVGNMETSMKGLKDGLSGANDLLGQFGLGISAMGIASAVIDLNNLGTEVRAVGTTFEQLAGGPEAAAQSLQHMRDMTGGVVDDMTLMKGANQLLLTGLAGTNEQAAELVNLGYRLSAAMGVDAAEGIQNLNAALLNNSYARLDTLGISAAAVRERVRELKEEGYDMSEAFSMAVLEQGREKLELLGVAASTGETAFARLRTSFQNAKQGLAEFTASGIEAGAQLIEIIGLMGEVGVGNVITAATGGTVDLEAQARDAAIQQQAQEIYEQSLGGRVVSDSGRIASTGDPMADYEAAQIASLSGSPVPSSVGSSEAPNTITSAEAQMLQIQAVMQATQEYAQSQYVLSTAIEAVTASQGLFAEVSDAATRAVGRLNRENSVEQSMLEGLDIAYAGILEKAQGFQEVGGVEIMSPEQVAEMVASADLMTVWFEDLSAMAEETEFQFISETELANAEAMTEEAQRLADQAERAGQAFERMSLAQMMGTTGGGRLGQMTDLVTGAIGDEGMAAQVQLELDMRSGRTSGIEQAFENEFAATIAQIAEQVGPQAAADAAQRALEALEQGQLLGLTDEQIVASVRGSIGAVDFNRSEDAGLRNLGETQAMLPVTTFAQPTGGAGAMTMSTPLAALTGDSTGQGATEAVSGETSPEESLAMMQEQLLLVDEQQMLVTESINNLAATDMTGVMDPFIHGFDTVNEATNVLSAKLDSISGKRYSVTVAVDLVLNDTTGIGLGGNPAFQAALGIATQNNGGTVPGAASGGGNT